MPNDELLAALPVVPEGQFWRVEASGETLKVSLMQRMTVEQRRWFKKVLVKGDVVVASRHIFIDAVPLAFDGSYGVVAEVARVAGLILVERGVRSVAVSLCGEHFPDRKRPESRCVGCGCDLEAGSAADRSWGCIQAEGADS